MSNNTEELYSQSVQVFLEMKNINDCYPLDVDDTRAIKSVVDHVLKSRPQNNVGDCLALLTEIDHNVCCLPIRTSEYEKILEKLTELQNLLGG
jgi:hypothetical protein